MTKIFLFGLAFLNFFFLTVLPAQAQQSYYIPPTQFNAALQIMDLGFSNVFGLFQNATGSFTFEDSTKTVSHLRFAIDMTSLLTNNPDNQRDLLTLLDALHSPELRITASESSSFAEGKADIKATLTLHGVSKPILLTATLNRSGKSPNGGGMWSKEGEALGLSMRGSFKLSDFGLSEGQEKSGRFGDAITLMLETQAIQQ